MRTKNLRGIIPIIFGAIAVSFTSCQQDYINLEYTNAKGEVPQLVNLVFHFNKAIYPDSLLNEWQEGDFISFEPDIPGRVRWNGPEELVFSPSQPLSPATTYKVKFKNDLFKYSKYDKVKNSDDVRFFTAPLQLTDAQTTWVVADGGNSKPSPQVNLKFNYPVKAEDLRDVLKVEVEGTKTDYSLLTEGTGSEISIRLHSLKSEDRNYGIRISMEPGLKPDKGYNKTSEVLTTALTLTSPQALSINNVVSEHTGTEGIVRIYTNQQLPGESLNNYIQFEPALKSGYPISVTKLIEYSFTLY